MRVETLLATTKEQRSKHLDQLANRNDPRVVEGETLEFRDEDVADTLNAWKDDYDSWMNAQSLEQVRK